MTPQADVQFSVSTWQQPTPPSASPERSALVERLAQRILTLAPTRLRVAVDGPTAAGKTGFGHELAEHLVRAGRPVLRACLDDFKRPWKDRHLYDRESGEGYYRNAYDYDAVTRLLLEPAAPDGTGRCVLCSIDPLTQKDHSKIVTTAPPDAVLVVDGVFAFRPEIDRHWDFRIWLDIDPELSVRRGAERDAEWAGADATALHRHRYLPSMALYESEVRPKQLADVVIDNTDFARPRVVRESR
ncbi:nucleoside/nucleotide kinase family protein [Saccharomonospora cyanea]|uniref:Uridine kinase n=1 Tax=Saccharomonospora cyanea NA-134 TaxID=882082 RepID=H5XJ38_9PSEU|nr:uridine kinase [Saccharomonospora cyanea]EHR61814.1 uridine kinase [Saccharomonospora cyanea NA-134]